MNLKNEVYQAISNLIFDKYILAGQNTPEKSEMEKAFNYFLNTFYEDWEQ